MVTVGPLKTVEDWTGKSIAFRFRSFHSASKVSEYNADSVCPHPFPPLRCSVVVAHPAVSTVKVSNSRVVSDLLAFKACLQGETRKFGAEGRHCLGSRLGSCHTSRRNDATCITFYHNCTTVSPHTPPYLVRGPIITDCRADRIRLTDFSPGPWLILWRVMCPCLCLCLGRPANAGCSTSGYPFTPDDPILPPCSPYHRAFPCPP